MGAFTAPTGAAVMVDFLSTTHLPGSGLDWQVGEFLGEHGFGLGRDGAYRGPDGLGTVMVRDTPQVMACSASGAALGHLRACGVFTDWLYLLASEPHSVTRLDAACDVATESPPILRDLYRRGCRGEVALTRKAASPRRLLAPGLDGVETGTVYLGGPKSRVSARVYDKRQEMLDRRRLLHDGPLTRFELTVRRDQGPTLRDAAEPAGVFWHFMSPDVLRAPGPVDAWQGHGEGLQGRKWDQDGLGAFRRRLEQSAELKALCEQAARVPGGAEVLRWRVADLLGAAGVPADRDRSRAAEQA